MEELYNGVLDINYDEKKKILSVKSIYEPDSRGLGFAYYKYMQRYKEKIFQYIADTEEEDTYGSALQRAVRTALWLKTRNLAKEDIVCLCTSNNKNSCIPLIATQFINRVTTFLDPSLKVDDAAHLIQQVNPKIFFVSSDSVKLIEDALKQTGLEAEIVVFGPTSSHTSFDECLRPHPHEDSFKVEETADIFDTAFIFFSSGTTGLAKGICLHHYGMMSQIVNTIYMGHVTSVSLSYTSIHWISWTVLLSAVIFSGASRVVCARFDAKEIWKLIPRYKVSLIFAAPPLAIEMIKAGRPDNINTTSLRSFATAGASVSEKHMEELRDLLPGTAISQAYGQTETTGSLIIHQLSIVKEKMYWQYKPSSVGRPVPGIEYKVVDIDNENVCGPNEKGELRVKSKYVMNGYYKKDSSESFDANGWLRTGDLVYYDEDFCFFIVDRIKEMLKYKTWHVQPTKLENILSEHPAVKLAVVIGLPDEEVGDLATALVILRDDFEATAEEIEEFVASRVDEREKLYGGVKFVTGFPYTPTGKVKRRELREMVIQGLI